MGWVAVDPFRLRVAEGCSIAPIGQTVAAAHSLSRLPFPGPSGPPTLTGRIPSTSLPPTKPPPCIASPRHFLPTILSLLALAPWTFAAPPVITEFMAANSSGLRDQDGDFSDWIELYNPDDAPASLARHTLTDDSAEPAKWRFPEVTIPGQGFLVVFASGKDRRDPGAELHTNFKLGRDGEYLALFPPDGRAPVSEFAPAYPRQLADLAYGLSMRTDLVRWVPAGATGRFLAPVDDQAGLDWTVPEFDDRHWDLVALGVGYDRPAAGTADPVEPPPTRRDITQPDDFIVPTSLNSPAGEDVAKAIDNTSQTKYLNFDKLDAGFTVTPAAGRTVVTGLRLTSANDSPDRDPTSYVLAGSDDGRGFVEIARGAVPEFNGRFAPVEVTFTNATAYLHYRLLFPTVREPAVAVAMQIAEVEFLGFVGAGPSDFATFIRTGVGPAMFGRSSSAFVRLPFLVTEVPDTGVLLLDVRYEDGLVAFLNGTEVARANAPAALAFDAVAVTNRGRAVAVQETRFNLGAATALLRPGSNVLAIQALNHHASSRDFLLDARLEHLRVTTDAPGYFDPPTPGSANGAGRVGLVDDLSFTPARGFLETPQDVAILCPTSDVTIRYTTNGSAPSPTNGLPYTGPIRLDRTTPLRAVAFREGWLPSRVATHTYLFLDDVVVQSRAGALAAGFPAAWVSQAADYGLDPRVAGPNGQDQFGGKYTRTLKADLLTLPSMSLVMDTDDLFGPQGLYAHPESRGAAWERAASIEWLPAAGESGFQENAGVRIQGGAFRRFDLTLKKSFRVVFREQYGATELEFPLFGPEAAERFDNLVLRANSNDAWPYAGGRAVYVRDAFAMETARAMGLVASRSRFAHLYLNGFYWGLYNPVERPDAAFSATYHGGDPDTWDALNQDSTPDGNYEAWNRLLAQINQGVSTTEAYQRLQGNNPDGTRNPEYEDLLNVENYTDYLILNFYVGNTDWPGRNWWAGRNRDHGDGFHFYPWDTETATGFSGSDVDVTGATGAVAQPYAALRHNADFRMQFADRVHRHFFHDGALYVNPASRGWNAAQPENNRPAARFAALAGIVNRGIVGESARWGDQLRTTPFTRDEHWQVERDSLLAGYFPNRSAVVLDQFRRAGLYPRTAAPVMNQRGGPVAPRFQLTLSAPQGTIFYTTNGSDPRVPVTIEETQRRTLVARDAPKRVLVPLPANGGDRLGTAWQGAHEPFNDTAWIAGTGGVGYDQQTDFRPLLQTDLATAMDSLNGSAFLRIPFDFDGVGRERLNFLILRAQYDDGFVAFLNGVRLASANAPVSLTWNALALAQNPDAAAVNFEEFVADDGLAALKTGRNILAVQGLNNSLASSDFLIAVELIAGERRLQGATHTALPYTGPITLTDLTTIKARALNGSEWSALEEATFSVGTPRLALTELHYHPAKATAAEEAAGFSNADDFEFVELRNLGTTSCDLTGVRFLEGLQFDFTGSAVTRLAPGHFVLVVKSRPAFELRYGPGRPVAGEYSGRLDNAGEAVRLVDARDATLLHFEYGTRHPWPEVADGDGPSLEVIDPSEGLAAAANWRASAEAGGSPGAAPSAPPLKVEATLIGPDQIRLRFPGRADEGYTVYARASLTSGVWEVLQVGAPAAQGGDVETTVPLSSAAARFFRVSVP